MIHILHVQLFSDSVPGRTIELTWASSNCCGVIVTTLFTPAVVSMPGADVLAVEDDEDDGEFGAGGLRLAKMMLLPWPA